MSEFWLAVVIGIRNIVPVWKRCLTEVFRIPEFPTSTEFLLYLVLLMRNFVPLSLSFNFVSLSLFSVRLCENVTVY